MFYDLVIDERIKGFAYALEPDRLKRLSERQVEFNGRHETHILHLNGCGWECDCAKYGLIARGGCTPYCAHVIAAEKLLRAHSEEHS